MGLSSETLRDGEIDLINRFTRRKFAPDEVYAFSVVLCDNDIDRDYERFSDEALQSLQNMFCGVTGVCDHDPKCKNQTARIFSCMTEKIIGKKTSDGKDYIRLCARAYMPKTDSTNDFITMLDSGIKKEVSVGCSVGKRTFSICGSINGRCDHIRGNKYDGRLCFFTLDDPTDAYEWSFVAVPAQKAAGVIKAFNKGNNTMNIEKRLFSGTPQSFSADELNVLAEKFRILNEKAADGDTYRRRLEADINKLAAFALPELKRDTLDFIISKMNAVQLEDLCHAMSKKAAQAAPLRPQLFSELKNSTGKNKDYTNI